MHQSLFERSVEQLTKRKHWFGEVETMLCVHVTCMYTLQTSSSIQRLIIRKRSSIVSGYEFPCVAKIPVCCAKRKKRGLKYSNFKKSIFKLLTARHFFYPFEFGAQQSESFVQNLRFFDKTLQQKKNAPL